jgi:hypothetical protein
MSLTLHYHPLSSYCWKALIALYENGAPFEPVIVDLGDQTSRAAHLALWPLGKMPVLRDDARGQTVPETSIIIDYRTATIPAGSGSRPPIPTKPGARGSGTGSSTCMSITICRRSSATASARPASRTRSAFPTPAPS